MRMAAVICHYDMVSARGERDHTEVIPPQAAELVQGN